MEQPARLTVEVAGWIAVVPAMAVALLCLLAPGLVVLAPMRMGLVARTALAGAISVTAIGAAGILFSLAGLGFAVWQPAALAVLAALAVWALRRRAPVLPGEGRPHWPMVLSWGLSAVVIGVVAFAGVSSPTLVSQTYDNVFHMSAIASILETGDASTLTLRTLIETGTSFAAYPSGWHSLVALVVQLTGVSAPVAVNAAWLAVCAVVWLPGVAWLAQVCLPVRAGGTVATVAFPLATAFGAFPYALLPWGTVYPTFLATALLPTAVAAPVLGWRGLRAVRASERRGLLLWAAAATAVSVAAVAFGQPRSVVTGALLMAIPAAAVAVGWVRRGWRAGGASRLRVAWAVGLGATALALMGAAGLWFVVFRLGLFERPLEERLGGPQAEAVQSLANGVWQVLSQSWLTTGVDAATTWPAVILAIAVCIGAVAAWRWRRMRWIVVAYALMALLFILAAGSDDVVTKLATALWYKDKYRLSSVLPVLGVPLSVLGVFTLARWARIRDARARRRTVVGVAWLAAVVSSITVGATGMSQAIGTVFAMPDTAAGTQVVSRSQIEFFQRLGDTVPEDQRVLGDPWDGAAWTLVFGDREPVFPHVNGQWDPDRATVAWRLADIDADPAVCAALDRLRVRYVVYSPHEFGGGDPSGNHFPGPHAAVEAGLFTLVETDDDTSLYRIDQCGPLN